MVGCGYRSKCHFSRIATVFFTSCQNRVVCAIDTYRGASSRVAIKLMNAQHWALGAQEFERLRLLWQTLSQDGGEASIVRPRTHFEQGDHFCIVFEMLAGLEVASWI
jgi:dual specificity tyrosine-phosphorylation-regulated kinase 2/3/4